MADPARGDDEPPPGLGRALRAVAAQTAPADPDPAELSELAAGLAAALRAIRGYVPQRIWWEEGPAEALLAYQATLME